MMHETSDRWRKRGEMYKVRRAYQAETSVRAEEDGGYGCAIEGAGIGSHSVHLSLLLADGNLQIMQQPA
eukprot:scaffold261566_cov38-Prasinocladus_malaysianus.AAC.1